MTQSEDRAFMAEALAEARWSLEAEGGPVGAVLVREGCVIGRGHNRLYQSGDPTSHAEMEAYRNAARALAKTAGPEALEAALAGGVVYTTAMPCEMCAGAIIRFRASRVVVGETRSHATPATRPFMERQGIEIAVLEDPACIELMADYLARYPDRQAHWTKPRRPPLKL